MNVYKIELNKLKKIEKLLKKTSRYKNPTFFDMNKLAKAFNALNDDYYHTDLSSCAYRKLYKFYGTKENTIYREKLNLYANHSNEVFFMLARKSLTIEQANDLLNYYIKLKSSILLYCPKLYDYLTNPIASFFLQEELEKNSPIISSIHTN